MRARLRKPSSERREEIARTALAIIGRGGLSALSTTKLASEIGVTSGALFRHFASREEMLEEAVRWAVCRIDASFPDPALPPLERLEALALGRIRLLGQVPGLAWLLRSEEALLGLPAAAVACLRDLMRRSRAYMAEALEAAVRAGDLRADVPPEVLLITFASTVHALIGQPGLQGRVAPAVRPEQILAGVFQILAPPSRPSTRRQNHASD